MSKLNDFSNSKVVDDNYTPYLIDIGTSLNTGILVFFFLIPLLFALVERMLDLSYRDDSTLINTIHLILYYGLDITAVILAIKWQKKKLANKSKSFKKKYLLVVASVLSISFFLQHL
jgi:hypothetical protein